MYRNTVRAALCALLVAPCLMAQTTPSATEIAALPAVSNPGAMSYTNPQRGLAAAPKMSRVAVGGGISAMGINLQAAVKVDSHLNIRGVGNYLNYSDSNISTSGFNVSGTIDLATAGVSLDYFPFPRHGLHISPGALLYNQNGINATMVAQGGTSFTLNDYTYYSSQANPVTGTASLSLNKQSVAPSITIGWGNMIPRNGSHWSFPFELGAAYIGQPQLNMALVSGQVCQDPQGTVNCQSVVGDPTINANLQAQIAKYQNDLNPLRFYPILSFGMAYSFGGAPRY